MSLFLSEDTIMVLFNWKLKLPLGYFGFLLPMYQQEKGVTVLVWEIDPMETRGPLLSRDNGVCLKHKDPLGHLLDSPCPVIKLNSCECIEHH